MAKGLTVPEKHQLKIARDTLKMPDAMAGVMGGPTKAQARKIIKELTGKAPKGNPVTTNANNRRLQGSRVPVQELTSGGMIRLRNPKEVSHWHIRLTGKKEEQRAFQHHHSGGGERHNHPKTARQMRLIGWITSVDRAKMLKSFGFKASEKHPDLRQKGMFPLSTGEAARQGLVGNPLEAPLDSDFSGLYNQAPRQRGRVLNPIVKGADCPSCSKPIRNPQPGTGTCSGCGSRVTVRRA